MTYTTTQTKKSQFTTDDTISNSSTFDFVKAGINKKTSWSNIKARLAEVFGLSVRLYETESAMVADTDLELGDHAIVEENRYALYEMTNVAAVQGDVTLSNGLIATQQGKMIANEFEDYDEIRGLKSSIFMEGEVLTVTNDGIGGDFNFRSGTVTDNGGTLIVFTDDGNRYVERVHGQWKSLLWYGFSEGNTAAENATIVTNTMRNFGIDRGYFTIPKLTTGIYPIDLFNPNNNDIAGEDITLSFSYNAGKTVTMGQITDCNVSGVTFDSTESDLENQRCQVKESEIKGCKFTNWLNPTNSNSWGVYIDDGSRVRLINCGFQNNTQSDIAIVDNGKNVYIENCYAINDATDPLHVNLEPNTSSENNVAEIHLCDLGKLYLLENGSGNTSNKSVLVSNCQIDELTYDGARAIFQNCQITDFRNETNIYFGEAKFLNSLSIGPNLIDDPYMMNIGFNAASAATDSNSWHINTTTGMGADYHAPTVENGIRFLRINDQNNSGVINFRPTAAISATSGDYYLIAITGRRANGSDARFCQIYDASADKDCFVFRQSTGGFDYFTTEIAIVPAAATSDFLIKIGTYQTTSSSCDIYAVSVHKVLGPAGGADEIISGIHNIRPGVREITVDTLPTLSDANTQGFIPGDRVVINGTGLTYYWDGTTLTAI